MNSTGVKTQGGRGSIVIENHDLIADIEQDRFIANTLEQKRFIFGRFPASLEKEYQLQAQPQQARTMIDALCLSAALLGLACVFDLLTGGSLAAMQMFLPVLLLMGVGILGAGRPGFQMLYQPYLLCTLALLGYTAQAALLNSKGVDHHWMLVLGVSALVFCARASLEMPALFFMAVVGLIVSLSPESMAQSGFYFAIFAVMGLALWVWREDVDRRRFLQVYVPQTNGKTGSGVKESERARQLVVLDKHTGLANNSSFIRFFSNEWRRAFRARQSLSLILISLDVTIEKLTEHGHLDRVLTELQRYSRRPGDIVGKTDERSFAVLLSNTDIANSRRLAESLLEHLHGLDLGKDGSLKVFMGVASTLPMPSMTHDDLYAKAKEALVAAEQKTH